MAYTKTTWVNDTSPAINATNLNKIEQGIYDAQSSIDSILPLEDQFVVTNDSFSMSISAGNYGDETKTYTNAGYYPLGLVGWSLTGSQATLCFLPRYFLSAVSDGSCTLTIRIRNTSTSAASPTVNIYILWVKIG